jgi:hypothetical protein
VGLSYIRSLIKEGWNVGGGGDGNDAGPFNTKANATLHGGARHVCAVMGCCLHLLTYSMLLYHIPRSNRLCQAGSCVAMQILGPCTKVRGRAT